MSKQDDPDPEKIPCNPLCDTRSEHYNRLPSQMSCTRSWHSQFPPALELVLRVDTSPSQAAHALWAHSR